MQRLRLPGKAQIKPKNEWSRAAPSHANRKTANARSPWAARPPGVFCVDENVDNIPEMVNVISGDKPAGKNSALPEPIEIHYRYNTK